MLPATTRGLGLPLPKQPPLTGSTPVDLALQALVSDLAANRRSWGILVRPGDDLNAVIASCSDGDTVVCLPGTYQLAAVVTVSKRIRLVGFGAQLVRDGGVVLNITADDAEVHGLQVWRKDRVAVSPAVLVGGLGVLVSGCTIRSASGFGLQVAATADYASVQGNKFLPDSAHIAADADVYWSDGATNGTACGNIWSRTAATFVLDYRAIDNMSEAANGDVAIINVR